jgi:hypothetical protein
MQGLTMQKMARLSGLFRLASLPVRRAILVLTLVILCSVPTLGISQPSLRSEVVPETGDLQDLFLFTVTVEGPQERANPQLSTSTDFEVQLLGPKTSISIVNGVVRSQQSFVYQLSPKRLGTLKTPEVQVTVNNQLLSAPSIPVVIRSSSASPEPTGDRTKEQLFMNQTAAPVSVYVGQQIVNTIALYSQYSLQGLKIEDDSADGFWQETLSDGRNSRKNLQGQEYIVVETSRALFPLRSGALKIPGRRAIAKIAVRKPSNPLGGLDPFSDDFFENFFQRTITRDKAVTSREITIDVQPLPPAPPEIAQYLRGIPIVGQTSLAVHYSDAAIKVGESKNISVIVTSEGNLNPIKSISLNAPAGLKMYDGQVQVKHDTRGPRLITQKTFSYSAVALEPGIFRIPGASLSYFDPDSKTYKLTTTSDITIIATGSPTSSTPPPGSANTGIITNTPAPAGVNPSLIPTLPPIQVAPPLTYKERSFLDTLTERVSVQLSLLVASATLVLVFVATLIMRSISTSNPRRQALLRVSKASSPAEVEQAIRVWLPEVIPGATAHSTIDELRALIRAHQGEQGITVALLSLLDEIEVTRYGSSGQSSDISALKDRLTAVVKSFS